MTKKISRYVLFMMSLCSFIWLFMLIEKKQEQEESLWCVYERARDCSDSYKRVFLFDQFVQSVNEVQAPSPILLCLLSHAYWELGHYPESVFYLEKASLHAFYSQEVAVCVEDIKKVFWKGVLWPKKIMVRSFISVARFFLIENEFIFIFCIQLFCFVHLFFPKRLVNVIVIVFCIYAGLVLYRFPFLGVCYEGCVNNNKAVLRASTVVEVCFNLARDSIKVQTPQGEIFYLNPDQVLLID